MDYFVARMQRSVAFVSLMAPRWFQPVRMDELQRTVALWPTKVSVTMLTRATVNGTVIGLTLAVFYSLTFA